MAKTSNTMLNKSGESESTCLFPDLRRKTFSYNLLSVILFMGLVYVAFIILRYIHFTLTSLRFVFLIINECEVVSNAFSASTEVIT